MIFPLLLTGIVSSVIAPQTPTSFAIHPDRPRQVIENFGASDSWTVEPLIHWPAEEREKVAQLLFDQKKGAGLSSWRFNIGGGLNQESINNPLRTVETFEIAPGKYDWTRCPGQMWMLNAAKKYGVPSIVAYSVTPPRRLTRNGFTNGTDGLGSTNLKEGAEAEYSAYLLDIVAHLKQQGHPVTHLSPVNEPDFEWNGRPQTGSQEGNRASNDDIVNIFTAIHKDIQSRKLGVKLLGPEANSPQVGYEKNDGMTKKYKEPYGAYVPYFADRKDWVKSMGLTYGYHSYWADKFDRMVNNRVRLKEALKAVPEMPIWQTEYCQMQGPRDEGGWGRDLGMTLALNTARLIHLDLTIVEASAWQWWLSVSDGDYKDGLVYVDDLKASKGNIHASKTLWALAQFSRYVRPGYRRIEVTTASKDPIQSPMVSAYKSPDGKKLVVVLVNTDGDSKPTALAMDGDFTVEGFRTSDDPVENVRGFKPERVGAYTVPPRSVTTLIYTKK